MDMTLKERGLEQGERIFYGEDHEQFVRKLQSRSEAYIGNEILRSLRMQRVGIAGCGTIGGNIAVECGRLGVEEFCLIDVNDPIDVSNLGRQPFGISDIRTGLTKAEALEMRIRDVNPYADVVTGNTGVGEHTEVVFNNCSFLVDGIDVSEPKLWFQFHEQARKANKLVLTGFDLGFSGVVLVFDYKQNSNLAVLNGKITPENIETIESIKQLVSEGQITSFEYLMSLYDFYIQFIGEEHIPFEVWENIITREESDMTTYQTSSAAHMVCSYATIAMIKILNGSSVRSVISSDSLGHVLEIPTQKEEMQKVAMQRIKDVKNRVSQKL